MRGQQSQVQLHLGKLGFSSGVCGRIESSMLRPRVLKMGFTLKSETADPWRELMLSGYSGLLNIDIL